MTILCVGVMAGTLPCIQLVLIGSRSTFVIDEIQILLKVLIVAKYFIQNSFFLLTASNFLGKCAHPCSNQHSDYCKFASYTAKIGPTLTQ